TVSFSCITLDTRAGSRCTRKRSGAEVPLQEVTGGCRGGGVTLWREARVRRNGGGEGTPGQARRQKSGVKPPYSEKGGTKNEAWRAKPKKLNSKNGHAARSLTSGGKLKIPDLEIPEKRAIGAEFRS